MHEEERNPPARPPGGPATPSRLRPPAEGGRQGLVAEVVGEVLRSPGTALERPTREAMEGHFGADFSDVRVHRDATAAASAQAVDALAYTVGNHIVFGEDQEPGGRLLAHELAHVLQQGGAEPAAVLRVEPSDTPAEREASAAADAFGAGRAPVVEGTSPPALHRATTEGWQDAGAGRPKPGEAGIDVERLMQEHRDVVLDEVLVALFLAISQDEISMLDGATLKYTPHHRLEIAYSRKASVVPWHCTDLVMNSAWRAGFVTPTGRGGFWEKSTATLGRVKSGRDPLVKEVPVPRDDPRTRGQDERKRNLRPGDVLVWGADEPGGFGHQMIIIERGETGGKVVVREAGASVEPRAEESLDPADRDQAVYRFLKFDPVRVSQSYTRDMTYRARFIAAFEQSSLGPAEKDRYRR
jgi:hypothetical protein